ncbi:Uncharacterized protein dnm_084460 [Desulfonema magnum]|uniref:Uncharacterized protein n=1 Tax=Desulfonema magnum TaxID=45655 RepID=A0A975GSW4_9BACT|nr:Uncharacterized protein dnm_084460 [Desulfonema magnum]
MRFLFSPNGVCNPVRRNKSQITNHFHINGHDLPVTTNDESFAFFPNT